MFDFIPSVLPGALPLSPSGSYKVKVGIDPYAILISYINNKTYNYDYFTPGASNPTIISNITLSDYSSDVDYGALNIILPKNTLNYIKQDIPTNIWESFNNGIPGGIVNAIAIDSIGNVYVGGGFSSVTNASTPVNVNNIAKSSLDSTELWAYRFQ